MWAHPPWVGRYLSAANRGRELAEYARWCNAVEGNTTFYAIPSPDTVRRWADLAPDEFRFAFKVPRSITHDRRLHGDAIAELGRFLDRIHPLGARIGPVQIQLPPSFGPDQRAALGRFVVRLPSAFRWAVELRHPGFFDGSLAHRAIDELLTRHRIGRVILDTRPLYSTPPMTEAADDERRTKPRLPVVGDSVGAEPIVRVIGNDDERSTADGLRRWIPDIGGWLDEGRRPYVFVHQPENRSSPDLARALHDEVRRDRPTVAALPTPLPVAPAGEVTGQESLF